MVKHTQTIRRQIDDELFECVWPFCEIGSKRVNPLLQNVPFWFPWKHQKIFGFLMFSGGLQENIVKKGVHEAVTILFTKYQLGLWVTLITPGHWYHHFRRQRVFICKLTDCNGGISDHFINPFRPSIAFHIETSHVNCTVKQMTGFYMKWDTGWNRLINFHSSHLKEIKVMPILPMYQKEDSYVTAHVKNRHINISILFQYPTLSFHTLFLWEPVLHSPH